MEGAKIFSLKYEISWLLEVASYCAVNCYGIISGYVMINSKYKFERIISLWFEVITYSVMIYLLFLVFEPSKFSFKELINCCTPTFSEKYWYFTSYFGMFILIPVLNNIVHIMKKNHLDKVMFVGTIIFGALPLFRRADPFKINYGYSMIWLCFLYVIGGYIKKYEIDKKISVKISAVGYFTCVIVTWLSKLVIELLTKRVIGRAAGGAMLIKYTSPTIIFAGIFLVLFFVKIEINSNIFKKGISMFAPTSFAVYLIHEHNSVSGKFILNKFAALLDLNVVLMLMGLY